MPRHNLSLVRPNSADVRVEWKGPMASKVMLKVLQSHQQQCRGSDDFPASPTWPAPSTPSTPARLSFGAEADQSRHSDAMVHLAASFFSPPAVAPEAWQPTSSLPPSPQSPPGTPLGRCRDASLRLRQRLLPGSETAGMTQRSHTARLPSRSPATPPSEPAGFGVAPLLGGTTGPIKVPIIPKPRPTPCSTGAVSLPTPFVHDPYSFKGPCIIA
eukprot:EG_transcript_10696